MKKPILYGGSIVLLGALATLSMADGNKEQARTYQRPLKTVSGEIKHIDEDSFAVWGYRAGSNAVFENLRIEDGKGLVHKLIYLGPSSYKVGDKVELEYRCLDGGISTEDLNDLLTGVHTKCQEGYVQADGIIK